VQVEPLKTIFGFFCLHYFRHHLVFISPSHFTT